VSGGGPAVAGTGPPPQDRKENAPIRDAARANCPAFVPGEGLALYEGLTHDLGRARLAAHLIGDELILYLIDVAALAAWRKRLGLIASREGAPAALLSVPTV